VLRRLLGHEGGGAPDAHRHHHGVAKGSGRSLAVALALNAGYTAAEAAVGFLTGSLALLADAGHNLSDVLALAVALGAVSLARRPPTPSRSFGFKRAEILAALVNALSLVAIAVFVFVEAGRRFAEPPSVPGLWLVTVAGVGVFVNLAGAAAVFRRGGEDLNLRASFVHLLGDALASVGVVVAGALILTTGWRYADPLVSVLIGLVVLASSWGVLRDAVLVLLEAAPRGIDANAVGRRMASLAGVVEVHDLHVWTITSGFPALSAHVLVSPGVDCHARRRELEELLEREFGIEHTTLQVDHAGEERAVWAEGDERAHLHRLHG